MPPRFRAAAGAAIANAAIVTLIRHHQANKALDGMARWINSQPMTTPPDSSRPSGRVTFSLTGISAGVIGVVVVVGAMIAACLALILSLAGHGLTLLSAAAGWVLRQAGIEPAPRPIPIRVRRSPYWSDDTGR